MSSSQSKSLRIAKKFPFLKSVYFFYNIYVRNFKYLFGGSQFNEEKNILDLFDSGVYGMHATQHQLPYGKGRSPINWGIINNADSLYANIFKYDEYVDNGMIFSSCLLYTSPSPRDA